MLITHDSFKYMDDYGQGYGPTVVSDMGDAEYMIYDHAAFIGDSEDPYITIFVDVEPVENEAKLLARLWVDNFFNCGICEIGYSEYWVYQFDLETHNAMDSVKDVPVGVEFTPPESFVKGIRDEEIRGAHQQFWEWISEINDGHSYGPNLLDCYDADVFEREFWKYVEDHPDLAHIEKFLYVTEEFIEEQEKNGMSNLAEQGEE